MNAALLDLDEPVRFTAIQSLASLSLRCTEAKNGAAQGLVAALRDDSRKIRLFALVYLRRLPVLDKTQVSRVMDFLQDEDPMTRIRAAGALAEYDLGNEVEECVLRLLYYHTGTAYDPYLAGILDCITSPSHAGAVERLLQSEDPNVRRQAERALARLMGDREAMDRLDAQTTVEEEYRKAHGEATAALHALPRSEVSIEQVHRKLREARLVLCGEVHLREGPLRATQKDLVKAFVKDPLTDAIGYEPCVEAEQREVLEYAAALGCRTISLEEGWPDLVNTGENGARDILAVEAITNFFTTNPDGRLFVLRGEAHVLPGGFLARRLPVTPMFTLCGPTLQPQLAENGWDYGSAAYELGDGGDLYWLPRDPVATCEIWPELTEWLQAMGAID